MIYVTKFRLNDLNPSKGKQIEFNKGVVDGFFHFSEETHSLLIDCRSVRDNSVRTKIKASFKLSPARSDYKIYQNPDGSKDLKDFFLDDLHLTQADNIDDFYAIKKIDEIQYILYYVPKETMFTDFFRIASNDQILFIPEKTSLNASPSYLPIITAIRTKPFILLAGISGTGKSRIVRELAFKSCPKCLQDAKGTTPGNYCMIEVKPNWHDSTELIGYYSNIDRGFKFKKFTKFLIKAKMFPKVPFFVCLDEMNLAPVEQYFAEILSIIETRKHPKNEDGSSNNELIKTDVIVECQYFRQLSTLSFATNETTGNSFSQDLTDRQIYMKLFGIDTENDIDPNIYEQDDLITEGLTLPDNVIIIGTVNMDDTTHQFSRKVIDRAMTIEMNGGNLSEMFGGSKNLEYFTDEAEQKKWQASFSRPFVTADEVLTCYYANANKIKMQVVDALEKINNALKGTPFEVSYRVLNELTIMVGVMMTGQEDDEELKNIINQAVDNILLMKILPRIEGDKEMFALKNDPHGNRLKLLLDIAPIPQNDNNSDAETQKPTAKDKIQEMIERLENQEFTRFWP